MTARPEIPMTMEEIATKIIDNHWGHCEGPYDLIPKIAAAIREAVEEAHIEIAAKQALITGESVMLNGKVVTNEELYKQPIDYVKEARAEGFREGVDKAAKIAETLVFVPTTSDAERGYRDGQMVFTARTIRALLPASLDPKP